MPKGVSLEANIDEAKSHASDPLPARLLWFKSMVDYGKPWDYKSRGKKLEYEAFGNFHYGVVGLAAGIPEEVLLRAAGYAHQRNKSPGGAGHWRGDPPYGDDPKDQENIKKGFEYYKQRGNP